MGTALKGRSCEVGRVLLWFSPGPSPVVCSKYPKVRGILHPNPAVLGKNPCGRVTTRGVAVPVGVPFFTVAT